MQFKNQVERCWKHPVGKSREPIQAVFSLKLKRDGTIHALRPVSTTSTSPDGEAYRASCLRALMDCQPYKLPDADYDSWRFFEPVFSIAFR